MIRLIDANSIVIFLTRPEASCMNFAKNVTSTQIMQDVSIIVDQWAIPNKSDFIVDHLDIIALEMKFL